MIRGCRLWRGHVWKVWRGSSCRSTMRSMLPSSAYHAWHRSNEVSRRLETIPGIGPITASALAASITDPEVFKNGRETGRLDWACPRQNSTGGKATAGRISKQGDQYLRWLLVAGAMSVVRHAKRRGTTNLPWLADYHSPQANQGRGGGARQQECPHCLGAARHGGTYQRPKSFRQPRKSIRGQ